MKHIPRIVLLLLLAQRAAAGEVTIVHINIGQGDATLILGPLENGRRVSVLIDCGDIPMSGKRDGGAIVGEALRQYGVQQLDWFIATHYDADHIGGIVAGKPDMHGSSFALGADGVPGSVGDDDGDGDVDWTDHTMTKPDPQELGKGDDVRVLNFVDRGDKSGLTTDAYDKYVAMAGAMGDALGSGQVKRFKVATLGAVNGFPPIQLGDGATMTCLSGNGWVKDRATRVSNVNTENERSLCFLLTYKGFDYLIGGDTIGRASGSENAQVERAIGEYLQAHGHKIDILHVNHHGANNASEKDFLEMVSPEVAIISAGNGNPHKHPDDEALQRLADAGVTRIYQTEWGTTTGSIPDKVRERQSIAQGHIVVESDGTSYEVSTSRSFAVDE